MVKKAKVVKRIRRVAEHGEVYHLRVECRWISAARHNSSTACGAFSQKVKSNYGGYLHARTTRFADKVTCPDCRMTPAFIQACRPIPASAGEQQELPLEESSLPDPSMAVAAGTAGIVAAARFHDLVNAEGLPQPTCVKIELMDPDPNGPIFHYRFEWTSVKDFHFTVVRDNATAYVVGHTYKMVLVS